MLNFKLCTLLFTIAIYLSSTTGIIGVGRKCASPNIVPAPILIVYVKYNLTASERSAMAQLRFGILPLNIETGRFRNQPVQDRLCTLCEFNEIEDKCHFLFKCSLYSDLRNDWITNITDKTPDFVEMDTTTKFKVIFAIHHRITAKFILRSYSVRKENLFRYA